MKSIILISIANFLATILMRYVMVLHLSLAGTITDPYSEYSVWRGIYIILAQMVILVWLAAKYKKTDKLKAVGFLINIPVPLVLHILRYYEIITWPFFVIPY